MKYNSTPLAVMSDPDLVITESSSEGKSSRLILAGADRVESLEQLTPDEQRDRHQLELGVEQAFYQAGSALAQIRDRRLYRSTHKTFDAYCQDRFNFTRRYSDYLIAATSVVENLQQMRTIHSQNQLDESLRTVHSQTLPTRLEQIKPLASLKPDEQRQVWDRAVATANGQVPSGRIVKEIIEQLKEKPPAIAQDDWRVGDIFLLVRLEGKNRKYNGCWAIALEFTDLTVIVDVHDATLTMKLDNLDKFDSPDVKQQLPQTLKRIRRLREIDSLDRGADNVLEDLGHHTDLTPVEEGLLSWLEEYYRVDEPESKS
ncbi:hypothetical protein B7486_39050 [cyanobacterium TDX16]|nr:hypothetical protein B7486_39050 [cyanobacterium TDX16]